jgi:hypothetical protein
MRRLEATNTKNPDVLLRAISLQGLKVVIGIVPFIKNDRQIPGLRGKLTVSLHQRTHRLRKKPRIMMTIPFIDLMEKG